MREETIKIKGMSCSHCVKSVEQELSALPLYEYYVSIGDVVVRYSDDKVSIDQIHETIKKAGYEIEN